MKKIFYLIIPFILISCASKKNDNEFEKIIFHTSKCFGTCPEYHLEINKKKEVKLFIEKAYQKRKIDTLKIGYYKGKLDNETYSELISLIEKIDLEKSGITEPIREPNTIVLKEGSQLSIILYIKNQRKPMIYIYPAGHWEKLMSFVYKISSSENLTKTSEELKIEAFN
ncbi:DUF6438 domain-containing protein [Flavobacterium okayamense]|uniref:DUF6438 domain-containing protein n=1 Tax=Flavobacterium okayamense TaxID=2830782 RepID=A0ABN6HXQ2_9FLAO|nr:DUF6438 domain-containing protein [Flavobacterium okayamense]BCY29056.1 hypothetical protein KK2020170_19240 [Flavobacterium okayamense]